MTAGQQQDRVRTGSVPQGRSGYAQAASVAGVATLLVPFLVPVTLTLSVLAVRDIQHHPERSGRTRAMFGFIASGIALVMLLVFFVWWR